MNIFDYFFSDTKELNKVFAESSKEKLAFNEMHDSALILAAFLNKKYGKGKNIIVISPNNNFFIICYLAIMKSGNVCVPLNSTIEQSNFDYILGQTEAELAFIHSSVRIKIPGSLTSVSEKEYREAKYSAGPGHFFGPTNDNELAKIIYTSGSTGHPKGVMLSHGNIRANTESIISYFGLTSSDIILVVMPFHYCYGLSLFHTHLKVGGKIILNNTFVFLGSVLNDLINHKCTGFAGVPSHYQILLRKSKSFIKTEFPSLRYVAQAGGKLHTVFIREFTEHFPDVRFYTMYGQTEATARLSYLPPEKLPEKLGSIGRGIPDVELRVVNEKFEDIRPGETGEIVARGKNVMLGYYKDPEMTSKTLVNGWLKTTDLATVDEDGYIFLTARRLEIIKVGGRRISPKEIEEVILSIPEVVDCTIEGIYDDSSGEAIKAKVVLNDSGKGKISDEEIRKYCFEKLASYKVPQIIEFEENLNIAATGKKVKKV
jgi:acyl-CoA synthetase (AMP-forming)/AMP-acid ligase II